MEDHKRGLVLQRHHFMRLAAGGVGVETHIHKVWAQLRGDRLGDGYALFAGGGVPEGCGGEDFWVWDHGGKDRD